MFKDSHDFPADTRGLSAQVLDVLVGEGGGQTPHCELRHRVCERVEERRSRCGQGSVGTNKPASEGTGN